MPEESTTPDLVELVRRFVESASSGDLDAMLRFYAPVVVWEAADLGTSFAGVPAIRGFLEDWLSGYETYEIEPEEILDLGNGVVFAVTRQNARPAGSTGGALVQEVWLYVFVWVEGMVARVAVYRDIAEGRAAAELLAEERADV